MVHGCMVYTERAEMAAVSCGTSHASTVSTPLRWIFKKCTIKSYSHSCRITCERSESARERRIALYKNDYQQIFQTSVCQPQQTLAAVVTSVQSICRTFKSNYKLTWNLQTWLVTCLPFDRQLFFAEYKSSVDGWLFSRSKYWSASGPSLLRSTSALESASRKT